MIYIASVNQVLELENKTYFYFLFTDERTEAVCLDPVRVFLLIADEPDPNSNPAAFRAASRGEINLINLLPPGDYIEYHRTSF